MDPGDAMDSDDSEVDGAMTVGEEPYAGGDNGEDLMMGMLTELNIVDITEVVSPPRVVIQGLTIRLKAGSRIVRGT